MLLAGLDARHQKKPRVKAGLLSTTLIVQNA